jgi:hypothetical protein
MLPTSPTIRIRLAKQPPLYFVAAVVVASLLPVLFQLLPDASAVALQRLPKLAAAPLVFERIAHHAPPGLVRVPAFAELDQPDEPELEEVLIVEAEPEDDRATRARVAERPREASPVHRAAARSHVAPNESGPRGPRGVGLEQRAKAACAARNKPLARSVYRALPLGDERRRTVRKACRESGILIL